MRSITALDLQYAHRFYGLKGEAQYLHGHTGVLTIGVEDSVEPGGTQGIRGAGIRDGAPQNQIDRCPLCGIALNEHSVCPKCGYKKP